MSEKEHQVPIWFFIGALLAVYGALILASGIYGYVIPPDEPKRVALWHLHADIWWGALLLVMGMIYVIRFRPVR